MAESTIHRWAVIVVAEALLTIFSLASVEASPSPVITYRTPTAITVEWSDFSTGVFVTSPKDISNVVLMDCLGITYKYDHVDGETGNFEHPSGQPITTVWVKSGNNESGDGPGYGEHFDNPDHDESCLVPCRVTSTCDPMPRWGPQRRG